MLGRAPSTDGATAGAAAAVKPPSPPCELDSGATTAPPPTADAGAAERRVGDGRKLVLLARSRSRSRPRVLSSASRVRTRSITSSHDSRTMCRTLTRGSEPQSPTLLPRLRAVDGCVCVAPAPPSATPSLPAAPGTRNRGSAARVVGSATAAACPGCAATVVPPPLPMTAMASSNRRSTSAKPSSPSPSVCMPREVVDVDRTECTSCCGLMVLSLVASLRAVVSPTAAAGAGAGAAADPAPPSKASAAPCAPGVTRGVPSDVLLLASSSSNTGGRCARDGGDSRLGEPLTAALGSGAATVAVGSTCVQALSPDNISVCVRPREVDTAPSASDAALASVAGARATR